MTRKRKLPDVGDVFGKLTVIAVTEDKRIARGEWTCRCECGAVKQLHATRLLGGQKSCGCGQGQQAKRLPQIGETFGNWTVLTAPSDRRAKSKWECRCKCGRVKWVAGGNLLYGATYGCGCSAKKKTLEHHRVRHAAKVSWKKLLRSAACGEADLDPSWQVFENFFKDLGERPHGTLLSRHDLGGGYTPANCFWETRHEQIKRLHARAYAETEALTVKDGSTKRCRRCKQEKPHDEFYVNNASKSKRHSHCKICTRDEIRAFDLANPAKAMVARARSRARDKGFEFSLIPEHLEPLPTHCPVFGFELTRGNGQQDPTAFSLDRIDNSKGYVPGNVVVMSYIANRLKNDGTAAQHARLADWMRAMETPSSLDATAGASAGLL